jgi:hypothetical protein
MYQSEACRSFSVNSSPVLWDGTSSLLAKMRGCKGTFNQIGYRSRLPDWKNQTLTPNPDSIYLMPFFNTKDAGAIHCRKCRNALGLSLLIVLN